MPKDLFYPAEMAEFEGVIAKSFSERNTLLNSSIEEFCDYLSANFCDLDLPRIVFSNQLLGSW